MRSPPLLPILRVHVPPYFRCPISLDLMRDPVTLSSGQTYDRSSIEQWLADGNSTCPVSRQTLHDISLIPNHMLRRLIQNWCVANKSQGVERIPTPKQPVEPPQVSRLTNEIASSSGRQERADALRRLRILAKECDKNRTLISDMGAVPLLVSALFGEARESSEDFKWDEVTEEALGTLVLLPLLDKNLTDVAQPSRLSLVANLLNHGSMEVRMNAGSLVEALAGAEGASDQVRGLLGGTTGIVEGLVSLLRESHYPRSVKVGIRALFALCLSSVNWERATKAGAASSLVECLLRLEKSDIERALATIELLCKTAEGREAVKGHAMAVPVFKKMILKVSDQTSESAAGALLAICSNSEKTQEEAIQEGIFTQLLLLLQSECTSRAKKKARVLLKLLRDNWPDHPCIQAPGRTGLMPF